VFEDLFATHPPVEERLANITGRKPAQDASSGARAAAAPAMPGADADLLETTSAFGSSRGVLGQIGSAKPEHVEHAARLLAAMPDSLRQSLNTSEGARCAVYAYLVSGDPSVRSAQDKAMSEAGDGAKAAEVTALAATLGSLGPAVRFPILTLAVPALRQMAQPARDAFVTGVDKMIAADHEVTLNEFVIHTVLERQLCVKAQHAERVRYRAISMVKDDALLLLATLARAGSDDVKDQAIAFARGAKRLGLEGELASDASLAPGAMNDALHRLRLLAPMKKADLVLAYVETALADDKLKVSEAELLRAIGMAIDCPLPPMLEAHSVE